MCPFIGRRLLNFRRHPRHSGWTSSSEPYVLLSTLCYSLCSCRHRLFAKNTGTEWARLSPLRSPTLFPDSHDPGPRGHVQHVGHSVYGQEPRGALHRSHPNPSAPRAHGLAMRHRAVAHFARNRWEERGNGCTPHNTFLGDIWPPVVQMVIGIQRALAVFAPIWFHKNGRNRYKGEVYLLQDLLQIQFSVCIDSFHSSPNIAHWFRNSIPESRYEGNSPWFIARTSEF